jgi:hypothetical protein
LRVDAINPYHHCWRFVAYAVVVFAALLALGLVACKSRLGGLKEARGGRCAVRITYLFVFKEFPFYSYCSFAFLLFALPAYNFRKKQ